MNQTKTIKKGRRPLYETPEELQAAVDEYFKSCEGVPAFDKDGLPIVKRNGTQRRIGEKPPTLSGLSLSLGFKNRQQFTRQKSRGQNFADVVSVARLRCEDFWERALMSEDTYPGAAFVLRTAFGWGKQESGEPTQPAEVRIVDKTRKGKNSAQGKTGDPSIMQQTHIDFLN